MNLTREQIKTLDPCDELDAFIGEHIMGWKGRVAVWHPSQFDSQSWVVRRTLLKDKDCEVIVSAYRDCHTCTIFNGRWAIKTTAEANTDCLAICRAAALAVLDKEEYDEKERSSD